VPCLVSRCQPADSPRARRRAEARGGLSLECQQSVWHDRAVLLDAPLARVRMARTPPSLPATPNALMLTPLPSPLAVTPEWRVLYSNGPRRSTPPACMARRPRDHRLSLEFLLHSSPPPAVAVGDRHPELALPARSDPPGYGTAAPPSRAATLCLDGTWAPTSGNGGHPAVRGLDRPSLVPLVLLMQPPRTGPGSAPRASPPARAGSSTDPAPPSSRGSQGSTRVGRAQRVALEARVWAASRAAAVEQPPQPRSPPAHAVVGSWYAPWGASPNSLGGGEAADGGRGWHGIGLDSPVSASPVARQDAAEVRLSQGTCNGRDRVGRRLQPFLLASSRPTDVIQPCEFAGDPSGVPLPSPPRRCGPDLVRPATLGTVNSSAPTLATTDERDGGVPPRSSRRIASPSSPLRGSKLRAGAVAKARVPCSRGCGHTFGNQSGMMVHTLRGGVALVLLL